MDLKLILFLISSLGILHPNFSQESIEHYKVSSPLMTVIIESTIDSCQNIIKCDKVEYLFVKVKITSELTIQVESIRKPLYKLNSIYQNDSSQAVSFYIGKTLCFADKKVLLFSGIFQDFKKIDCIDLSNQSFEYDCLDIDISGKIYNTLITFSYIIENEEVVLENHSIFIDGGDVDLYEELKKRGIRNP